MYNKKDIPALLERIKKNIDGPYEQKVLDEITGPGTGLVYNEVAEVLHLAEGWLYDSEGNIVRADDVTGPGVQ